MKAQKKPVVIDYYPIEDRDLISLSNLNKWISEFGDSFSYAFEANSGKITVLGWVAQW